MSEYAAIIFDDDERTPSSVWYGTKEDALGWADEACAKGKNAFVALIVGKKDAGISQQEKEAQDYYWQCQNATTAYDSLLTTERH
ncbi:hypothetical protein [Oleidesulfovibrio sp.]|uniref:hypothetical protein n=1 Tax=Oleidesulfovibrio sp. TaxID=2909707 RepID=UPI003A88B99F